METFSALCFMTHCVPSPLYFKYLRWIVMYFKLSKFNQFVVINCLFGIYYFRIHEQLVVLAYFCVEQNSIFVFISSCKKVINFLYCHLTKNSGKFCCWFSFIVFAHNEHFLFLPLFREFIFEMFIHTKNRPIFCRLVTILKPNYFKKQCSSSSFLLT